MPQPDDESYQQVRRFLEANPAAYCYGCIAKCADVQPDLVHRILKPRSDGPLSFTSCDCADCGDWTWCAAYVG